VEKREGYAAVLFSMKKGAGAKRQTIPKKEVK
jgi:hypothetical protein